MRALVDALPCIVWQAEAGGRVTFLNPAGYAYAGLEPGRPIGWRRLVVASDIRRVAAALRDAARRAETLHIDVRLRGAGGGGRWFALDAVPVLDADGTVDRWVGTALDIDHRVGVATAQRDAAARAAFLARTNEIMSRVFDPERLLEAVAGASIEWFANYCLFDVAGDDGSLRRVALAHRDHELAATFDVTRSTAPPVEHETHPVSVAWRSRSTVYRRTIDPEWQAAAAADAAQLARIRAAGPRSLISVVVETRGHPYGILTFCRSGTAAPFEDDDRIMAEELARHVAIALENATLYAEARRAAEAERAIAVREAFYSRLGEALSRALDLEQTLSAVVELLVPDVAGSAVINLIDAHGRIVMAAVDHTDPARRDRLRAFLGYPYLDADSEFGSPFVVRTGQPQIYTREERFGKAGVSTMYDTVLGEMGLDSSLIVPIVYGGVIKGTLLVLKDSAAGAFSSDDLPSFVEIARRISPAIGNAEAYQRERFVAQTFQNAALRIELPAVAGFAFEAIYEAGKSEALVGGDWYDAFVIADGRVVVSIGDVVGSGLEAAIAMVNVRQTIRGVAQIHPDPALMLLAADRTVRTQYPDRFVTAFAAVLDPVTKRGSYANAGHLPALLRAPDGSVQALEAHTLPLGLIEDSTIAVEHFGIEPECSLLLYTDGLVEAERNLLGGLSRLRAAFAADGQERGAARRLYEATIGGPGSDDAAMLLITSQRAGDLQRWRFDPFWRDAVQTVRARVVAAVLAAGVSPERAIDVEMIFAELLSNLLRYANGTADLFLERNAGNVVLHLLDKGPGFQFNPRLPADLMSESGRGLYLIAALADQFSVERRPGGGSHARIVLGVDVERFGYP